MPLAALPNHVDAVAVARKLTLEDWPDFLEGYHHYKTDPQYSNVNLNEIDLEYFFKLSMVNDSVLFIGVEEKHDLGFLRKRFHGFLVAHTTPRAEIVNGVMENHADLFVRGLFLASSAPRQSSTKLDILLCSLAKKMGVRRIYGHCRTDFPVKLAERFGFEAKYVVMEKTLHGRC